MIGLYASSDRLDDGFVRRPMPGDALGSALRGLYTEQPRLPEDMERLLRNLDRPGRDH